MLIKKKHQTQSFPYFFFRYHPVFLPFFRSPGTLYAPQVTFRPYLTGKGEGGGRGGKKLFPLIKAVRIMLSKLAKQSLDIVSGQFHCAATSILLLKKNPDVHVNWSPLRDSPDNLSSIVPSSELTQNVSLRTSQRWPISIFNRY